MDFRKRPIVMDLLDNLAYGAHMVPGIYGWTPTRGRQSSAARRVLALYMSGPILA